MCHGYHYTPATCNFEVIKGSKTDQNFLVRYFLGDAQNTNNYFRNFIYISKGTPNVLNSLNNMNHPVKQLLPRNAITLNMNFLYKNHLEVSHTRYSTSSPGWEYAAIVFKRDTRNKTCHLI